MASLDSLGQTKYVKDSGVLKVSLGKDEVSVKRMQGQCYFVKIL